MLTNDTGDGCDRDRKRHFGVGPPNDQSDHHRHRCWIPPLGDIV